MNFTILIFNKLRILENDGTLSLMFTTDFSSFDIMLLYLKSQTCFIMPAEFSIKIIT